MTMQRMTETDPPQVFSLDGRSPDEPRFGSIHALIGAMLATLAVGIVLVL